MKVRAVWKRVAWITAVALLWVWEGQILYSRARAVFPPDRFAFWEKVVVPADVEMAIPGPTTEGLPLDEVATDPYAQALLKMAADPKNSHMTATCDVAALDWLGKHEMNRLRRYLACHPGWRFSCVRDRDTAIRRVRKNAQWHAQDWEIRYLFEERFGTDRSCVERLASQCEINFGELEFYGTKCRSGESVRLDAEPRCENETDCEVVCYGDSLSLNVVEWSSFPTCRVMQTAFDLTKLEFERLKCATNEVMMMALLPEGSMRRGPAAIELFEKRTSFDHKLMGHSYQAWVNPGEHGEAYLRAFEVSQGVELQAATDNAPSPMMCDTLEYAGWSEDPAEKFLVGSEIMLHDGLKGSCVVRLEVWFRPANGGPERKLVERVFKIDGGCDEGTDHR